MNGHTENNSRCVSSNQASRSRMPHIENFNGKFRDECLNEHRFLSMPHARETIDALHQKYNDERPAVRWVTCSRSDLQKFSLGLR
jgi:transposase InsO family protein